MFYIMTKGGMMQGHMHLQHIINCILNILPLAWKIATMVDFIESKEFATFHIMYFIPQKMYTFKSWYNEHLGAEKCHS
jgi:hypothetical protein